MYACFINNQYYFHDTYTESISSCESLLLPRAVGEGRVLAASERRGPQRNDERLVIRVIFSKNGSLRVPAKLTPHRNIVVHLYLNLYVI